jgi:hypothetical protein
MSMSVLHDWYITDKSHKNTETQGKNTDQGIFNTYPDTSNKVQTPRFAT